MRPNGPRVHSVPSSFKLRFYVSFVVVAFCCFGFHVALGAFGCLRGGLVVNSSLNHFGLQA